MLLKEIIVGLVLVGILSGIYFLWRRKQKKLAAYQLPPTAKFLLYNYVPLYRILNDAGKQRFEERMRDFLSRTVITGVEGVVVHDIDKIFIAASAIMPLYAYDKWRYYNLNEILLYPSVFNKHYDTDGYDRNVLGMVGDGVLNRHMILSQPALRAGFMNPDNAHNTAIHEFAHLIDKADGAIDGVPQYLLNKENTKKWRLYTDMYMQAIKEGLTDINPYATKSKAEFFAVMSEYYFKQPGMLQHQYPDLYAMLQEMYHPNAA